MARFHSARGGHPFSDLLRNARRIKGSGHAGTKAVGEGPGIGAAHDIEGGHHNPGGVTSTVPGHKTIPPSSKHMDGKSHPVPRGHGSMQTRRGLTHPSRVPANISESVRLGNHGQPPGHGERGSDLPFGGKKEPRERRSMPANMRGKAHPVGKRRHGHKPKFNIGDAHHNVGTPKIGKAHKVGRDLAGYI
jgi:hypothetical protein